MIVVVMVMPTIVVMVIVMMMMVVLIVVGMAGVRFRKTELRGGHPGPQHTIGGNRPDFDGEAPEGLSQFVNRQSEIEYGAQNHVP